MTSGRRWPLTLIAAGATLIVATLGEPGIAALTDRRDATVVAVRAPAGSTPSAAAGTARATPAPAIGARVAPGGAAVVSGLHPGRLAGPAASAPTRLVVPRLGLDTSLIRLGLLATGALQVPVSPNAVGWYTGGPTPGSPGPAVLAGHVDSQRGPGVFFRLKEMRPGDAILVRDARGRTLRFTVTAVAQYAKDAFPTAAVYGPTTAAELRLITCGGTFDWARHHYRDNVVVYARLAGA